MTKYLATASALVILAILVPAGCPGPATISGTATNTMAGTPGTGSAPEITGDSLGNDATTPQGDAGTATDVTNPDTPAAGGGLVLTGRLAPGQAAKRRPRAQGAEYPYTIVAQSDETGRILRVQTDPDGGFTIEIPDEETGNSFMVTVLGPDGRTVGPVTFGESSEGVVTGIAMDRPADLGLIELPDDPTQAPIQPGIDGDALPLANPEVVARTNAYGVPVGLESFGKGAEAGTSVVNNLRQTDADADGLIDMFDADDDGNGIVDDFDGQAGMVGTSPDARANFFMNLKVSAERAQQYYGGTTADLATQVGEDTVITFEVLTEPNAARQITAAHLLETPGPAYLPDATLLSSQTGGGARWADSGYAFAPRSDRFDAFVVPHAEMQAGDTFTVVVTFDNGTTEQYSRMLNFIFKNIPRLLRHGTPGTLTPFSVLDPNVNGTPAKPIPLDGSQDLVLEFVPPLDEGGEPLTGMNYSFQIFYSSATQPQLNGQINAAATWPTPIPGFQNGTYYVPAADLGSLSTDNTYTVTLPKETLPDTIVLTDGSSTTVTQYTIDITAECPSGNAALKVTFEKQ